MKKLMTSGPGLMFMSSQIGVGGSLWVWIKQNSEMSLEK